MKTRDQQRENPCRHEAFACGGITFAPAEDHATHQQRYEQRRRLHEEEHDLRQDEEHRAPLVDALDRHRRRFAATDAQRRDTTRLAVLLERRQQCHDNARA